MTLFEPPPPRREIPDWHRPPGPPVPPGAQPPIHQWQPGPQWYAPPAPPPRPARTREQNLAADRVVAIVLLALGLVGTIVAVATSVALPAAMRGDLGSSYFESRGQAHSLVALALTQIVLFVAALGCSIALWRAKRISFWVPLIASVVATIVFWSIVIAYATADHSMQFVA